uniref:Uncharacterized protein n=1 Tax=Aplanochytrium stocchinoi TaxID=215587 RepID=A0A7S3PI15_9STRA
MKQLLCVFQEQLEDDLESRLVIVNGGDCAEGIFKLPKHRAKKRDLKWLVARAHKSYANDEVEPWCTEEKVPRNDPFYHVNKAFKKVASFLRDEIVASQEKLDELASYGMNAWIDGEECNTYFELVINPESLEDVSNMFSVFKDVNFAVSKFYFGPLQLNLIFSQGSFYSTLKDASYGEQTLFDEEFPNVQTKGAGVLLKTYTTEDEGDGNIILSSEYKKLSLWLAIEPDLLAAKLKLERNVLKRVQDNESKSENETKECGNYLNDTQKLDDQDNLCCINDESLWNRAESAFEGGYTQTFLLMKASEEESNERRAFFRYGNWCYGGFLDMDHKVNLAELPHVLRKFQQQQGKLEYMFECEPSKFPESLPFTKPMQHLGMATALIEEEVGKSEEILTKLNEYHESRGLSTWINQETGQQYFELECVPQNQEHYKDVDILASKVYFQEVICIIVYFKGSFYVTLSASVDDQPLLDMSFPDVSSKGRGFQIFSYNHREFKKLMLWQSERSVWETANRAVLERKRREAEERASRESVERETEFDADKTVKRTQQTMMKRLDVIDTEPGGENKSAEPMEPEQKNKSPLSRNSLSRNSLEMKQQGSFARAPHHLKPLGTDSFQKSINSLPDLGPLGEAPWDALGRPKVLFGSEKGGK